MTRRRGAPKNNETNKWINDRPNKITVGRRKGEGLWLCVTVQRLQRRTLRIETHTGQWDPTVIMTTLREGEKRTEVCLQVGVIDGTTD